MLRISHYWFAGWLIGFASLNAVAADDFSDVPVIDTHIHLYDTRRAEGIPWPPRTDQVLFRPVLPKHFEQVAVENAISAAVIVEASSRFSDNQWVLDLVRNDPERYVGLVGSLQIGSKDFAGHLKQLSRDQRFVGIRMRERPGGEAFFSDVVWRDLKLLADEGLTLDVLMFQFSLNDVAKIAREIPRLKILINHVAGADIDGQPVDPEWLQGIQLASAHENVFCKISGLFQQSHQQPSPTSVEFYRPTLDALTEAFGEDRLIYGSNWPVTMRGGTYGDFKKIILAYYSPRGRSAIEKLMYRNATAFYGVRDTKPKPPVLANP